MLNRAILIGRLAVDPRLSYTQNGVAVTTFRIAVDRPFTNQQGERETDFFPIVTWRKLAEICANNLGKGRLVAVDGRMQTRRYDDQDGVSRWVTEVVADQVRFLDWPKDDQQAVGQARAQSEPQGIVEIDSAGDEGGGFNSVDVPF